MEIKIENEDRFRTKNPLPPRNYKFRGYNPIIRKWIYGSLIQKDGKSWIHQEKEEHPLGVIPESVGQYIGVKTPNKLLPEWESKDDLIEIYEGDIVEAWSNGQKGVFQVVYRQEGVPCFILYPAFQKGKMFSLHSTYYEKVEAYVDTVIILSNIYQLQEVKLGQIMPETPYELEVFEKAHKDFDYQFDLEKIDPKKILENVKTSAKPYREHKIKEEEVFWMVQKMEGLNFSGKMGWLFLWTIQEKINGDQFKFLCSRFFIEKPIKFLP